MLTTRDTKCVCHELLSRTIEYRHDDPHHTHNECECECLQLVTPSVCATNYCHEPLNTGMMTPTTHIMSANVYAYNSWHTVTQCVCHELVSQTIEYRRSVVRRAHHLCICESRVTNYVYASNSWHTDQEKKNSIKRERDKKSDRGSVCGKVVGNRQWLVGRATFARARGLFTYAFVFTRVSPASPSSVYVWVTSHDLCVCFQLFTRVSPHL